MNFLLWNTNKKDNDHILEKLIINGGCDFIGLAEYHDLDKLLNLEDRLNSRGYKYNLLQDLVNKRINILSKYEILRNYIFIDSKHYRIVSIQNSNGEKILIAVVHFLSKLHCEVATINAVLRSFRVNLEDSEKVLK